MTKVFCFIASTFNVFVLFPLLEIRNRSMYSNTHIMCMMSVPSAIQDTMPLSMNSPRR